MFFLVGGVNGYIYMQQDGYHLKQTVTFGQPKVANFSAVKKYDDLPFIRVVTSRDMVPLLPPADMTNINNPDIYWHMGEVLILLEEGQYSRLRGLGAMLRASNVTRDRINEESLQHHLMGSYLQSIRASIRNPEEVPFKHKFFLFDLFGPKEKSKP